MLCDTMANSSMCRLTSEEIDAINCAMRGSTRKRQEYAFNDLSERHKKLCQHHAEKSLLKWRVCGVPDDSFDILSSENSSIIKKFGLVQERVKECDSLLINSDCFPQQLCGNKTNCELTSDK